MAPLYDPDAMDARTEIREFLTSRRARLKAADVGLPDYGAGRVPGLRRERSPFWPRQRDEGRRCLAPQCDDVESGRVVAFIRQGFRDSPLPRSGSSSDSQVRTSTLVAQ
jgi:hypothetical protein